MLSASEARIAVMHGDEVAEASLKGASIKILVV